MSLLNENTWPTMAEEFPGAFIQAIESTDCTAIFGGGRDFADLRLDIGPTALKSGIDDSAMLATIGAGSSVNTLSNEKLVSTDGKKYFSLSN
jgi:hypothetical protein